MGGSLQLGEARGSGQNWGQKQPYQRVRPLPETGGALSQGPIQDTVLSLSNHTTMRPLVHRPREGREKALGTQQRWRPKPLALSQGTFTLGSKGGCRVRVGVGVNPDLCAQDKGPSMQGQAAPRKENSAQSVTVRRRALCVWSGRPGVDPTGPGLLRVGNPPALQGPSGCPVLLPTSHWLPATARFLQWGRRG